MCRSASPSLINECYCRGAAIGLSIARVSGELSGPRKLSPRISLPVPFSLLPDALFKGEWSPVDSGRWRHADHVTLGESRAVVRLARLLLRKAPFHRMKFLSLQDNMPTSGAMTRGRSTSWPLNFLCRQRSAASLAGALQILLPWVESDRQPADDLSRRIDL